MASEFTDFELAVLGALMDSGANLDYYTAEQLKCFPAFIKAEAATQYLDLRPNSEKIVNGEYVPRKSEDLAENDVPGVILVQRTNTNGNTPTVLEYKKKEDFENLIAEKKKEVLNYFTISDEGNLVIAKWNQVNVAVSIEGEDGLPDDIKTEVQGQDTGGDQINITTEEISYSQYISKYTMPFEFLLQLLVITEEPDFCTELVDYVLNSKIVINIQEEETYTETTETRNYIIHNKDNKYISYQVKAADQEIGSDEKYFLKAEKDDKGNDCTSYSNNKPKVTITKKYTSHSYRFEIVEADTWIVKYEKIYDKNKSQEVTEPTVTNNIPKSEGEYTSLGGPETVEGNEFDGHEDVNSFIKTTEEYYQGLIEQDVPHVKATEHKGSSENSTYTYQVDGVAIGGTVTSLQDTYSVVRSIANGKVFTYIFSKNGTNEYVWNGAWAECTAELKVEKFQKIDLETTVKTDIKKYLSDPNPTTKSHIYATESGNPGTGKKDETTVYEKFLVAYDNSSSAQNQLNSIDSWLYEMMEENQNTVELVNTLKYLLYMYDGKDRGVTELDISLFNPSNFSTVGALYGSSFEEKIWWALIDAGFSKEAAAGAMGNFWGESSVRANNLEDSFESTLGYTDESYTAAIDNGTYKLSQFISDHTLENCGAGYGLAQWTYYNRKEGLYNFAKECKGVSIADENMQIEYMLGELEVAGYAEGYATGQLGSNGGYTVNDWKNASTPERAAEVFCWIFERPAGGYDSRRSTKAREYYDKFKDQTKPEGGEVQAATGDGYSQVYTSSTGRTYKEYKQWMGSYASNVFAYYSPETIAKSGCSITAVATVTSGYNNNQTPGSLASRTPALAQLLTEGGAQCSGYESADVEKLTSGKPAVVNISGTLITENGSKYYGGHFIAILDARNGNEVYVSDVGANDASCGGWTNVQNIINILVDDASVLYVNNQ